MKYPDNSTGNVSLYSLVMNVKEFLLYLLIINPNHMENLKAGDIVRYAVGFSLRVTTLYANNEGDLFVNQCYGTPLYVDKPTYSWGGQLRGRTDFRLANEGEIAFVDNL